MKRSRSGHSGFDGSNFMNLPNSTVATSAMPMGMPGWPEFAFCTASIARARRALAMSLWVTVSGVWEVAGWMADMEVSSALALCGKALKNPLVQCTFQPVGVNEGGGFRGVKNRRFY